MRSRMLGIMLFAAFAAAAQEKEQPRLDREAPVSQNRHLEVYASSNGTAFSSVGTSTSNTFLHHGLAAERTYLYKVRAVNSAGKSEFSTIDPATTVQFTALDLIRAEHFRELRRAINAFRTAAAMPPYAYTDPVLFEQQTAVKAAHLTDLRVALDSARDARGFPVVVYSSAIVPQETVVSAADLTQLRNLVQ